MNFREMLESFKVGDFIRVNNWTKAHGTILGYYVGNKTYDSKSLEFICDKIKESKGDPNMNLTSCGLRLSRGERVHHSNIGEFGKTVFKVKL